jgi:hypothetical protein
MPCFLPEIAVATGGNSKFEKRLLQLCHSEKGYNVTKRERNNGFCGRKRVNSSRSTFFQGFAFILDYFFQFLWNKRIIMP